ncbi:MAG: tetratricopeptide repeat protein, partial [Bacteroidia bacterium]|nr:tetratricopeptide repeat protein [Bacteroidia bacterium]
MVYLKQEEKFLKRAELIYMKMGDKSRHEVIINRTDQASLNNNIGNSPQAEVLFQEVAESCRRDFGPESPAYAAAINNLAVLYYNTGIYKLAEKYFIEAAAIYKGIPDRYRAQMATCINNLGALYHEIGNYKVAEELLSESRNLMVKTARNESPDFSVILNNLASVSISEEYFASPENKSSERLMNSGRNLRMADSVFRLNCQKPHPIYQSIISNNAIWYNLTGDKKKSNQLFNDMAFDGNLSLRVVAMMNKMSFSDYLPSSPYLNSGPEPIIIPVGVKLIDEVSASNMEVRAAVEGDPVTNALLRMILGKATNIKKAVGIYHPAYAEVLKSLTVVYASVDDVKTEEELTLEYLNVINHR